MQWILGALMMSLVMIGFITNCALWTPVNLGTVVVDLCCMALIAFFVCSRSWRNASALRRLRLPLVLFAVFTAWCVLLAVFGSNGLWERVMGVRNNVLYFGLWALLALSLAKYPVKRLLDVVWYCGLVVSVLAIVQSYCHESLPEELLTLKACGQRFTFDGTNIFRVTGIVGTPLIFAGFSSFVFLLGWMRPERETRLVDKLLLFIPLYAMYLTYTRTSNVALLLSWGVAWCLWAAIPTWRRIVRAVVVLSALLFLLFGARLGPQELRDSFVLRRMAGVESTSQRSTDQHRELLVNGMNALLDQESKASHRRERPAFTCGRLLTGLGMGSQGCSARDYSNTYAMDGVYYAYLLETGLVGFLLMAALVVCLGLSVFDRFRRAPRGSCQYRLNGLILLVGLYFGLSSLLNSSFIARTNFCLFWCLVGMSLCDGPQGELSYATGVVKMNRAFRLKLDQIHVLIAKDFKLKYNSTALGFVWSLLMPTFTSVVYYFVFGIMMRFNAPNYLLYLMSGTFLWQFLANVIMMNGGVLSANQGLLKKTSFDRELLVRGTFYTESIHFLLTVPVLLGMMAFYRVMPDWLTILPNLIVCLASLMLFATGISYAYAAINLYFRDLERIMNIVIMMWMFCSPVFIPISALPQEYLWVFNSNPAAMILMLWRDIFYQPGWHPQLYWQTLLIGAVTFYAGRAVFRKMEPGFAEMM